MTGLMQWIRTHLSKNPQTILLVEKEPGLRNLVSEVVASRGYKVLTATDGEQAMKIFSRFHSDISLVFSDVALPKLDGDRLLEKMLKIDPHVRVIFSSGYCDDRLKSELLKAGAKDVLQQPQMPEELLTSIRHALNR